MKLKKIVCFNGSVRHSIRIQKNLLSKYNNIIKKLTINKVNSGGRNNNGHITVRHRGGGCSKRIHLFVMPKACFSLSTSSMYNANANSFISLNFDLKKKIFFKSTTVKNVYSGCLLEYANSLNDFKYGYRSSLKNLPVGSLVNSLTLKGKNTYSRSAGTFCQIIQKKKCIVKLKLPSGVLVNTLSENTATLGFVDNSIYKLTTLGKAGRARLKGTRPSVRGIAMNPVDHPHGGKSNKGMHPVTPWGLPTRNRKTVKKKYEQI